MERPFTLRAGSKALGRFSTLNGALAERERLYHLATKRGETPVKMTIKDERYADTARSTINK